MIRFGTFGWRGILAEEFTFQNVTAVSKAIARYLQITQEKAENIRVAISCDTRFLSEKFVSTAASALQSSGIHPIILSGFVPTPVLSFTIMRKKLDGGINITASNDPPEWNGIKLATDRGSPASLETTNEIERIAVDIMQKEELPVMPAIPNSPDTLDPFEDYVEQLQKVVDFEAISNGKIGVAVDPMFGAGIRYMSEILRRKNIRSIIIHATRDATFGGRAPDPSDYNLAELKGTVVKEKKDLGIALNGDADRYGIIDRDGSFVHPNLILGLLTDYLIERRGWKSGVGLSIATGHLMKEVAKKHALPVYVTPVGFSYLGELIIDEKAFIIGEESGGLSIQGHTPEKDGILATLLVLEMVSEKRKSIRQLRDDLFKKVGAFYTERVNIPVSIDVMEGFDTKLKVLPEKISHKKIKEIDEMDGIKIILEDNSWILYRKSGTESAVRMYAEAHSKRELSDLVAAGKKLLLEY